MNDIKDLKYMKWLQYPDLPPHLKAFYIMAWEIINENNKSELKILKSFNNSYERERGTRNN